MNTLDLQLRLADVANLISFWIAHPRWLAFWQSVRIYLLIR